MKVISPGAVAALGASDTDELGRHVVSKTSPYNEFAQQPICAALIGSNRCSAPGITAHGSAPIFSLCRKLIEAGHDPAMPLEVWRGDTLALTVHSVGEAAKVEVSPRGVGFVRRPAVRGGAHVAENGGLPELPWPGITDAA